MPCSPAAYHTFTLVRVAADEQTAQTYRIRRCTGAFVLADAGLLNGKHATTHHDALNRLQQRYPQITVERGMRYVQSDPVILRQHDNECGDVMDTSECANRLHEEDWSMSIADCDLHCAMHSEAI